jgi:hypothetical protein
MTTLVKKSLKEERFHPANVLKEMDRKGGVLSYEGVEVLRTVEGAQKHSHDMIIPSTSSLQRCAVMVEAYGESIVGKLKVDYKGQQGHLNDLKVHTVNHLHKVV